MVRNPAGEMLYAGFEVGYFRFFLLGIFVHVQELLPRFVLSVVHSPYFFVNLLFFLL